MRYFIIILSILLASCAPKTVETHGGLIVNVGFTEESLSEKQFNEAVETITGRANSVCNGISVVKSDFEKQTIEVQLPVITSEKFDQAVFTQKGDFSILETFENSEFQELLFLMNAELVKQIGANSEESHMIESLNEYPLFEVLVPNIYSDNTPIPGSVIGRFSDDDRDKLWQYLNLDALRNLLPKDCQLLPSINNNEGYYELHAVKIPSDTNYVCQKMIKNARPQISEYTGDWLIGIDLKPAYHDLWARQTEENIDRALAIVIDGEVYTAPRVMSEITGGKMQITGTFTREEADNLVSVLEQKALHVKTEVKSVAYYAPGELEKD